MKKAIGICALTGERGRFVKSHLIPRALTRPRPGGKAFPQMGNGTLPIRRRDSWYDPELVVRAGEDILTAYDTFAITELRRHKLIWQSWGPMLTLATCDFTIFPSEPYGLRLIHFSDPSRMRGFLLSLLWRAAASKLTEFTEVRLRAAEARRLRAAVRDGTDPPINFFPATLTQLSTRGPAHNFAPLAQVKRGVSIGRFRTRDQPILRFYFDGLIVHFHPNPKVEDIHAMLPFIVGAAEATTISTVRTGASWEMENLTNCISDAKRLFPGMLARAGGI